MSARDLDLDHLSEPDRFAKVARLHQSAFAWKRQGRIPLGIHVVNPNHTVHQSSSATNGFRFFSSVMDVSLSPVQNEA